MMGVRITAVPTEANSMVHFCHPESSSPTAYFAVKPINKGHPAIESAASIIGQIHHLIMRWQKRQDMEQDPESLRIMLQAFPALKLPLDEYIDQVTGHITRFSTAAIDGLYPEVSP